jgi:secreted trypsin-like serine protease
LFSSCSNISQPNDPVQLCSNVNYSKLSSKNKDIPKTIVGGSEVTNQNTTLTGNSTILISMSTSICTGVIVANNLILTAAHCFGSNSNGSSLTNSYVVFTDNLNNINLQNAVPITTNWYKHPSYSSGSSLYDIAWIKIDGNISNQFSGYTPVPILLNPQSSISPTEPKWSVGFGSIARNTSTGNPVPTSDGGKYMVQSLSSPTHPDTVVTPTTSVGYAAEVTYFDSINFPNAYENYLTVVGPDNNAQSVNIPSNTPPSINAVGVCQGDSGGPMFVMRGGNYILAAITQGTSNILTPHPTNTGPNFTFDVTKQANCNDGYSLRTTIGNYVNWISSTSGVKLTLCQ